MISPAIRYQKGVFTAEEMNAGDKSVNEVVYLHYLGVNVTPLI
jgi:hypothetical protein